MQKMKANYFEARGVGENFYENATLPHYFKEVIESLPKNAKILDFGCGFGQILNAIKTNSFAWNNDKNAESSAINVGGGRTIKI